jgi:hypothetical protein
MHARDDSKRSTLQTDHNVTDSMQKAVGTSTPGGLHSIQKPVQRDNQGEAFADLRVLLDKFQAYFAGRSQVPDLPMVLFGLKHLFSSMHTLCTILLPQITHEALEIIPHDNKHISTQRENSVYSLWLLLQSCIELLLKIEPLCQLVQNALINMLETLDMTCSIRDLASLQDTDEMIQVAYSAKRHCTYIVTGDQDRWQHAITRVRKGITAWRIDTLERLTRLRQELSKCEDAEHERVLLESVAAINRMCNACIESSGAIFGDILPDLHVIAPGDDEGAAIILLDLMQRLDQLVIHVGGIVEPLHLLLYQVTTIIDIQ